MKIPPRPRHTQAGPPSPRRPRVKQTSQEPTSSTGGSGKERRSLSASTPGVDGSPSGAALSAGVSQDLSSSQARQTSLASGTPRVQESAQQTHERSKPKRRGLKARAYVRTQEIPQTTRRSTHSAARLQVKSAHHALRTLRKPTGQADAVSVLGPGVKPADESVERIDERIRARHKGYVFYLLTACLAVVGVAGVMWVVFFSSVFALQVDRIEVSGGNDALSNDAAAQLLSAHASTPITRLSMSSLEDELRALTQVKEATVKRSWPAGISVELVMRTPVMVEHTAQGFAVMDDEAVVLAQVAQAPAGLAVVTLPQEESQRRSAATALTQVRSVLPEHVVGQIVVWDIRDHQIQFELSDGRLVKWGTTDDSELKGKVLPLLIEQRPARVYDVSSPTTPVTSDTR